jgi:hypothetical protein
MKISDNVILEVASNVKVDFQLEVGTINETVEVSSSVATLQTQEASVGGIVTSTELDRMPVNGRNYTRLILLMQTDASSAGAAEEQRRPTQAMAEVRTLGMIAGPKAAAPSHNVTY